MIHYDLYCVFRGVFWVFFRKLLLINQSSLRKRLTVQKLGAMKKKLNICKKKRRKNGKLFLLNDFEMNEDSIFK